MKKLLLAVLCLMILSVAGCGAQVVARYDVGQTLPSLTYDEARKALSSDLQRATIEKTGFLLGPMALATMADGFKFNIRQEGIDFTYYPYYDVFARTTFTATTACDFEYLGDLFINEYAGDIYEQWRYEVPLGQNCDNLAVYFPNKDKAFNFARILILFKKSAWVVDTQPASATQPDNGSVTPTADTKPTTAQSIAEALATLKKMKDDGLITQPDYDAKKAELLKKL